MKTETGTSSRLGCLMLYNEWQHSCWRATLFTGVISQWCSELKPSDNSNWSLLTERSLSVEPHCTCPHLCLHPSQPACVRVRCPFMCCSAGLLRPPHCPIWSLQGRIMKGYVPRVTTTNTDLVFQNKKNKLCYVTHGCCCCFWWWQSRRKAKGLSRDKDKMTGRQGPFRDGWAAQALLPKNCADTISVLGVLFTQSYTKANSTAAWHHWLEAKQNSSLLLPSISNLTDESTCLHPRSRYCCWVWSVLTSPFCLPLLAVGRVWLKRHSLNGLLLAFVFCISSSCSLIALIECLRAATR